MKRILFQFPGHGEGKLFNPDARDNCLQPFIYLRDVLKDRGYELLTADDHAIEGCEWIWFWDVPSKPRAVHRGKGPFHSAHSFIRNRSVGTRQADLLEDCIRKGKRDRLVLFLGEPPVVSTPNWETDSHEPFRIVFTWNDTYVDGDKYHKLNYVMPQSFPECPRIPFHYKKLLVNISGNKFSTHPQELYTARRVTIQYFESRHPKQFDLYGTGWNQIENDPINFKSYRGVVTHKWDIYPNYRFGVCYENTLGAPGYITEKLFDCMRAGCVPIYWGAPNITEFVDEDAFIDRGEFSSDEELADFLLSMTESEYEQMQDAIRVYLGSDRFAAFMPPVFTETIIRVLGL